MKPSRFSNYQAFHESREGLTSVITTVAIIAIVMGFIVGPYFLIIIPEQIKENESEHLKDVEESFLKLRQAINSELDTGIPNSVLTTSVKLGTDDENLFVKGGNGELRVNPSGLYLCVHDYYDPLSIYGRGSGNIIYKSKNLYHPNKNYIFENGGIIYSQQGATDLRIKPNFEINRNHVTRNVGLIADFGDLTSQATILSNVYLINTYPSPLIVNSAKISWDGGNATTATRLNIGSTPIEWSGNVISKLKFNFTNSFTLNHGSEKMSLKFNADMRDSTILIELFTNSSIKLSDTWPNTLVDTHAHAYTYEIPAESAKRIIFKNNVNREVTINRIALSWTGAATLTRVNIQNHGGDVWSSPLPGESSPTIFNLTRISSFHAYEHGEVRLYFNGIIDGETVNVRFFAENSTNFATTAYPVTLNQTYTNVSFNILSLITDTGDKIHTAGKSSKVIKTTLISVENNRFIWENSQILVFNITTNYGDAWFEYLNKTLGVGNNLIWDYDGIGSFPGDYFITTEKISDELVNIKLILNTVFKLDCQIGVIKIEVS